MVYYDGHVDIKGNQNCYLGYIVNVQIYAHEQHTIIHLTSLYMNGVYILYRRVQVKGEGKVHRRMSTITNAK